MQSTKSPSKLWRYNGKQYFEQIGLAPEEVEKALEPLWAYYYQIEDEVKYYEKVKEEKDRKADWKDYANEIARKLKKEGGVTEEEMLEELKRVRKEMYDEWKDK